MGERVVDFVLRGHDRASGVFKGVFIEATAAIRGVVDLARGLAHQIDDVIEKARHQAQVDSLLAQSLEQVKGATSETYKSLREFANEIQRTTGVADDQAEHMMQLFASFGHTEEEIRKATIASLDYAAATGVTATNAAIALSKAAHGNTDQLREHGIMLDVAKAKSLGLAWVSEEVGKNFRGMAAAANAGVHGGLTAISNSFGDLKEAIGSSLTHSKDLSVALQSLSQALQIVGGAVAGSATAFGDLFARGIGVAIIGVGKFVEALPMAASGFAEFSAFVLAQIRELADLGLSASLKYAQVFKRDAGHEFFGALVIKATMAERAMLGFADTTANAAPKIQAVGRELQELGAKTLQGLNGGLLEDVAAKVRGLGKDHHDAATGVDKMAKALANIRAEIEKEQAKAAATLRGIEDGLKRDIWVGWGEGQEQATRAVIARYDELREKIAQTELLGHDTTKALALAAEAQSRELQAVQARFAKKAEKDLAKEEKEVQKTAEGLAGSFGRTFRAVIEGDAGAIGAAIARLFVQLLSTFGGPLGSILGSFLGGIFHQGSGNVHGPRYAHSGLTGLGGDERMLIYRTPEAVVNDRGTAILGRDTIERANRGEPVWGPTPQVTMAITIDGSRIDHRDFRVRQVGEDMRRATRYSASEWARLQRGAGLAPGR